MQHTKFISLLQTFSKEELKRFDDFIKSPYFNKLEAPVKLYKTLLPQHPNFDDLKWDKLFKKAFPDKPAFSETYLRNVLSDLNALAEDFLGNQLHYESPMTLGNAVWMLIEKKQYKSAEDKLVKMKNSIETNNINYPSRNTQKRYYYMLKMRLHDRQEQRAEYSKTQQQLAEELKNHLIVEAESLYFEMSNDNEVYYQYPYEYDFYKRFVAIVQPQDLAGDNVLTIFHYRLLLQTAKTWDAWQNLYEYLQENKKQIPDLLLFLGKQALTNHLAHRSRIETLPDEVIAKGFLLYEEMIALRLKNGHAVTGSLFENIILYGYALYGTEWSLQYIEQNKEKLPENIRTGLCAYCMARLYFSDANYTEAIAVLANIEPFYDNYYFAVKSLLIQCYYEINSYDVFMGTVDTFKKTLANHPELAQKHQTAHTNFAALMLKLYRLRNKYSHQTAAEIQRLLQHTDIAFFNKSWIEKKFQELIKVGV
ncbi:hypothetical protein C7N43_13255 [Sphingobacteriales bacterium UPWRP_1]|nr:hypothetical protein BVG80_14765 [Sphingobacteriales bacterium TSM_CSM]PSJ76573.1 hypothetical protein C7N43_13255 [Sphingobacteriales bacterium UPWRP_1]